MRLDTKEDIKALLEQLEINRAVATKEIPPDTYPGDASLLRTLRVRAQETVQQLESEYARYIEHNIGAIILKGDVAKAKEFARIAEEEGDTLTYDTNDLYRSLVARTHALMGGQGSFGVDQIASIFSEIRLLTRSELGIFRLREPNMAVTAGRSFFDINDLADAVRDAVFFTNGLLVTHRAILKYVTKESLAHPNPRTVIPVVIIGMKDSERAALEIAFPGSMVEVNVDEAEDMRKLVIEAFKNLKKVIKTNKGQ